MTDISNEVYEISYFTPVGTHGRRAVHVSAVNSIVAGLTSKGYTRIKVSERPLYTQGNFRH
jgi:hypothetical protein